jgi:hypothetical protein
MRGLMPKRKIIFNLPCISGFLGHFVPLEIRQTNNDHSSTNQIIKLILCHSPMRLT